MIKQLSGLVVCCCLLAACATTPRPAACRMQNVAACQAAIAQSTLLRQLQASHVKIFTEGDYTRVMMPTAVLFKSDTIALSATGEQVLNEVTALLQPEPKLTIQVAAYTSARDAENINIDLTRREAWMVARYLVQQGVDTRFIYADGLGSAAPVSATDPKQNDRIELHLRAFNSAQKLNLIDY